MPEVPKKVVPEEKIPVAVPKKPEPPPAKGTCHYWRKKKTIAGNHSLFLLNII